MRCDASDWRGARVDLGGSPHPGGGVGADWVAWHGPRSLALARASTSWRHSSTFLSLPSHQHTINFPLPHTPNMYLFPLPPAPSPVDYSTHLIPTSSSPISPVHLSKATQQREAIRTLLSRAASSSASGTEAKLVSAIEEYLPSLAALFDAIKTDDVVVRSAASFQWAPPLDPSSSSAPPSYSTLGAEVEHVVLLYAISLHNLAILHALSAGPTYDFSATLPEAGRKERDATVKRAAATWGVKAVRVARWLYAHAEGLQTGCGGEENKRGGGRGGGREGAVRCSSDEDEDEEGGCGPSTRRRRLWRGVATLLELSPTLAMLRVLTSAANSHAASTGTRPPPLPPGHASPGLLAKLFLEVPRIADEAKADLEAATGVGATRREGGDTNGLSSRFKRFGLGKNISNSSGPGAVSSASRTSSSLRVSPRLMRYLTAIASWGRTTSLLYLGLQAGEETRHAEASVWLRMARDELVSRSASEEQPDDDGSSDDSSDSGRGGSSKEAKAYVTAWDELTGQRRVLKKEVRPVLRQAMRRSNQVKQKRVGGLKGKLGGNSKSSKSNSATLDTADGTTASSSSSIVQGPDVHPLTHRLQQYHSVLLTSGTVPLLAHLYKMYRNLNDSISFQPLPARADLLGKMPGPRTILSLGEAGAEAGGEGWQMPKAEWGTRLGRRREGQDGDEEGLGVGLIGGKGGAAGGEDGQSYAGQGAYY